MIGGKLRDFSVRTRELSQLSSAIAERMAGAKMKEAMEGLQEIFSRVRRLDGESGLGRDVLTTILENFGRVQTHLLFFEGTVRQLHALCSFIRIENARSGRVDTGFDTLADDVMVLARNIESQSARLLDQVTVLTNLIGNNLEKIRHFDEQQHRKARHILDDAVNNLSALREKYANSTEAMKAFSLRWNRLSSNIGEVVSAMQFHDITRQRIEHVSEALADLTVTGASPVRRRVFLLRPAHLQSERRDTNPARMEISRIGGIAAACELQAAQLSHARDEFVSAVQAIIENIRDIAENVEGLSEETLQLAGAADDEGNSFLTTLDAGLASLTDAISNYESANDELTAALGRTVEMVEQMSEFVSQIEKIGIEIRIIAINASIHAAHIGEEGLALGVLADALRPLSLETSRQISAISGTLMSVIGVSREFSDKLGRNQEKQIGDSSRMADRLEETMELLRSLDKDNLSLLERIGGEVKALLADIGAVVSAIHVHERIDQTIDGVNAVLAGVMKEMRAALPAGIRKEGRPILQDGTNRYTMDKEREIHRKVASGANPVTAMGRQEVPRPETMAAKGLETGNAAQGDALPVLPNPDGADKAKQEDLGDNVELF